MLRAYEQDYTLLNKLYKQEQNTIMQSRLKNAKSIVNTNCPNSFNYPRKRIIKSQEQKDLSKQILYK